MKQPTWEDVAPYLDRLRSFDNALLVKIKAFVQDFGYQHVTVRSDEFANSGSGMRVSLFLDTKGKESFPWPVPMDQAPVNLEILISSRGPLITSCGNEWRLTPEGSYKPPGLDLGGYAPNPRVDAQARELALKIAQEFSLLYVDREWLRSFRLSEKGLTSDASLSLEFSEPDALNVLFNEFI